ncbi:putative secreted protein [Mycolicibacterium rhodesiae JS60]|nr:putative secreted protein [Mycolicibacterium rhodesiae JS60]
MRGIVMAPLIAGTFLAATISLAAAASATSCHSASCVPNVAHNVVGGTPCTPSPSFVFGLDAQNGTLICAASGVWMPTGPLVGEAQNALPCTTPGTTAQQRMAGNDWEVKVPGVPLICSGPADIARWIHFPPA